MYKVDEAYAPKSEAGIRWDDPDLAIEWMAENPILSVKDNKLDSLSQFDSPFEF
jgi:dTDP-4-dehydrorhamnose 3,5-epimerase